MRKPRFRSFILQDLGHRRRLHLDLLTSWEPFHCVTTPAHTVSLFVSMSDDDYPINVSKLNFCHKKTLLLLKKGQLKEVFDLKAMTSHAQTWSVSDEEGKNGKLFNLFLIDIRVCFVLLIGSTGVVFFFLCLRKQFCLAFTLSFLQICCHLCNFFSHDFWCWKFFFFFYLRNLFSATFCVDVKPTLLPKAFPLASHSFLAEKKKKTEKEEKREIDAREKKINLNCLVSWPNLHWNQKIWCNKKLSQKRVPLVLGTCVCTVRRVKSLSAL